MRPLREALEHTPTVILREIAAFWEIPEADKAGRPRLVGALLERMEKEEAVRLALRRLDREERDALRHVLASGGRLPAAAMIRAYGPLRPPHLAPGDPAALNPTERLHRRGFLFRAFATWENYHGPAFFVPAEMWPYLPHVPRAQPASTLRPLPAEGIAALPADLALHRDMACLLAFLQREAHFLTVEGNLPETLGPALPTLLAPPHPAYGEWLLHVGRQAGLLAPDAEGALRPTGEARQWLHAPAGLRAQVLFQAWREHPTWDDLAAVPELRVERPWKTDLTAPRQRVLHHLGECPVGTWFAANDWIEWIAGNDPEFLRPGGAAGRVRVYLRPSGLSLDGPDSWGEVEGAYLRFLLRGPLYWLGLVDLGQEGAAFRLTPLGDALLHAEAPMPTFAEEKAIVEGNFQVWVPLEASPYLVFLLECYAERVQRDRLSCYSLTRPALQRALQRGERLETLLEALARYGRGELPQNVAYTLQEWASAYGQLYLRRPLVLSADQAVLMTEVLSDPTVQAACAERLAPGVVEVLPDQVAALVRRLAEMGRLPEVEPGVLPEGERLLLPLSPGQGPVLLALLWAWGEMPGRGEHGRALSGLAEALARLLPPAGIARARRLKERWARQWRGGKR